MSWLNLNQSFNSLKGQISTFASEVLSEGSEENSVDSNLIKESTVTELEEKCQQRELEIASLKKLTEELQAALQSERLSKKNGVKEEESSWYWDPPPQSTKQLDQELETQYKLQIRGLQDELSALKDRDTIDLRPDVEEELNRLRKENQNLTANIEDLDNQHQQAMDRLLSLKRELQTNFEILKQEHEDLKNSNDEYTSERKVLLARIGEKDSEIENLKLGKADYETLYHKYQNLERVHSLLRENAEKFQEENQDLHEEVFKLQEQVTKLEHDIEIANKHSEVSNAVPKEKFEKVLKELSDLKERRSTNKFHLDEINIDDNAKSVIENLKRDINDLKHKLSQKESGNHNVTDQKNVKAEKIMQLYNKYVNFEIPVDYVGEIPSVDDNIVLFKLESVFKTVNSFKKDIDNLEHKISEKNHNVNHLQTQIDDLTTENDFLTTDIQHLERELNEMKKNNDFLISEIAALKNTSKLEPIIETHEDNLAKLETELADCNNMNKSFESEIKRIEKELAVVRTEKNVLQDSLADLKLKYTTMLSELEMCKNQTKAVVELEHTANCKESEKLKTAFDEIDDLKKRLNAANSKNEQLSIDIHIIDNDKVLLTKQVDDLKNALEEKSTAHKDLESLKIALDLKLQDFESKLDEVIRHKLEVETEKSRLEEKVTIMQNELLNKENSTKRNDEFQKLTIEKNNLLEKYNTVVADNNNLLKSVENLKANIDKLKTKEQELSTENHTLKHNTDSNNDDIMKLQDNINELKNKLIEQENLAKEAANLKEENSRLVERKLKLETELSATDIKIVHLEEDFEKLIADLNEKDILIDALNTTIADNKIAIFNLSQNVSDLENSTTVKNDEIERLKQSLEDITVKFNESILKANQSQEELNILHTEKEEINKQIFSLTEEINSKNVQISSLTDRLEDTNKTCQEYKAATDSKVKEIKELNQSIVELTDKIKTTDNTTHHNDEYARLLQEKEIVEKEVSELKNNIGDKHKQYTELNEKYMELERVAIEYKTVIDTATNEKAELINLINLKHNESIQYHNEIQRLNHVVLEQANEFKRIIEEKDSVLKNQTEICTNCESLRITLKEKDEIIISLNQNCTEFERMKSELLNATDTIKVLTEKCNNLDKSLAIQLETVKKLTAENVQLSELEQNAARELERLRRHLVDTEENYTQELMTSEQKLTECQARLHQVEERAKQTSTVYTSNSIRANQEVETLRTQIKLLEKQREEVQARLSDADDARSRSEAALTNLQVVLEQFQLDKEREVRAATEKIRNKMEDLKRQNVGLQDEIARLNNKLEESLAGLQAATRLGDQLETKSAQINDLKEQVRTLQTSVSAAEERYYNAISNQQDKVDKNLVKNLVINYVMTATNSSNNKTQVLRVLSTVLDFNQQECEKLGLARAPNTSDSLAAEFVKFLQNESRPRAPLPNMMGLTQSSSRSTTPTSRKSSTMGPQPTFEKGHKRIPSTGSNNLLFQNIDGVETASQISRDSDREPKVLSPSLDTGVNQTRNTESAILKSVLKDM